MSMNNKYSINIDPINSLQIALSQANQSSQAMGTNGRITINASPENSLRLGLEQANKTRVNIKGPAYTPANDYNDLKNLPSLGGITIRGNLKYSDLFLSKTSINTKEYWNSKPSYIPERGEIIIYENKSVIDGQSYPGIKIGDGNAYIVDLPFLGDDFVPEFLDILTDHVNNMVVHVTAEEREFWNNKLNYEINDETLVFNTL